ncbi:MAG: hypothetical protein AAF216_05675 [Pseudomonadota bacterium]
MALSTTPSFSALELRENDVARLAWAGWVALFGLFSAIWPRDAGFDVLHYQLHNGWSAYYGRLGTDLAPAEMHSFLNPAYNLGVWWLIEHLPGRGVAFVLGAVQALTLPALYLLIRRLAAACDLELGWRTALVLAGLGFVAAPSFAMLASVRNDDLGALAIVTGLALALPARGETAPQRLWLIVGAALVGAAAGMKLTNIIYVASFAAFVLVSASTWTDRLQRGAICAAAGATAFALLAGPWMWTMWQTFGNPVFPNMSGLFPSDIPVEANRDTRYLPNGLIEALGLPLAASVVGKLINEFAVIDFRLALSYLGALSILLQLAKSEKLPRAAIAIMAATLVLFSVWVSMFSIQRYAMAIWLIGPAMAWFAFKLRWPQLQLEPRKAWTYGGAGAAALLITTSPESNRRVDWSSWSEAYVEIERPADLSYDGALILTASQFPAGFTAAAFPEATIAHVDAQAWSAPFLLGYRPRIDAAIARHDGPIYLVHCWPKVIRRAPPAEPIRDAYSAEVVLENLGEAAGFRRTDAPCLELKTNLDSENISWRICPVEAD